MQVIGARASGGAEHFYVKFVRALAARGDLAVLPVVRTGSWIAHRLETVGVPHETAPFGGPMDLWTRRRLAALARQFRPTVVQSWMSRASRHLPRLDVPTCARLGGYYKLKNYGACDWLICISPLIQDYVVQQGWPRERTIHITNYAPDPPAGFRDRRVEVRQTLGIPADAYVVLMVGRLHPNKGFDTAFAALGDLPDDVHILLVGDGPLRGELHEMAGRLAPGRVHFAGWQTEIAPFCGAADLWLVPSRHEPLGSVLVEAWLFGLPLVAAASDGPRVLIDDGRTGLLVPIDDAPAMAAAIGRVRDDPALAQGLVAAGLEHARTHHSEAVVVDQFLDFYRQLA